jgi:hypothetical protein
MVGKVIPGKKHEETTARPRSPGLENKRHVQDSNFHITRQMTGIVHPVTNVWACLVDCSELAGRGGQ